MEKTLPVFLLAVCLLGCNKFGPDTTTSTSNSNTANAKAPPAPITKIVDLPGTLGKSKDEIKKMVNGTPKKEDPWLEYSLPEADLTFQFTKEKADSASLTFKSISVGSSSISGTDTAEQIGTMAGVDIKGKAPKSTGGLADTYEVEIGGKKLDVAFYRANGKFIKVMITPRRA